jgi:hypothetical protein
VWSIYPTLRDDAPLRRLARPRDRVHVDGGNGRRTSTLTGAGEAARVVVLVSGRLRRPADPDDARPGLTRDDEP